MLPQLSRAGEWFLRSGIQEPSGGVARYYLADQARNLPVSTEITGYAASALVYLHSASGDERYLRQALQAARFLTRTAWDPASETLPFELEPRSLTYFFDNGIIVRGLLACWRSSGDEELLAAASAIGKAIARDFAAADGDGVHPILALPGKEPIARDPLRWSRSPGCYQLKSAMAWRDLFEATGDTAFCQPYEQVLAYGLRTWNAFLPGHPDQLKVMDRLHAFLYFLEGLLPRAHDPQCAAALCAGIRSVADYLRSLAPQFERADVYAQLLRIRLYAHHAGAAPLDLDAAAFEAGRLAEFQVSSPDPRIDGGYRFGRTGSVWSQHVSPVSTAFALQALDLWHHREARPPRHLLI